jgi:Ca-activated chloride channel family protein
MKKIALITASILILASFSFAANGFKEGNKLYLGGKYQDASGQYQQFIQKNPEYYEGYFNAGNALFRQEQYDKALGMYKKAQELNPKDPDVQYNIDVTQKKIEEKKKQCENPSQDKNGQQGGEKKSQDSSPKTQEDQKQQGQQQQGQQGQQKQAQAAEPKAQEKQPPSGMTEDEVQALLNQKQNQEKRLQGYFGKQYPKQNQDPDMFNMSPQQIMQYMMQKQMDPNFEPPQQGGKGGNEKDW